MNRRRNGSSAEFSRAATEAGQRRIARAFGVALRSARERRGMSQEQLADYGGFERGYPSLLEHGLHEPSLCEFIRVSMTLGIAPGRLLEDTIIACTGSGVGRTDLTDLIQLREIWAAFAGTLSQCGQEGALSTAALGSRLLDELARHGLTVVALPTEPREGRGHA